jgi:hypothetical protein
MAQVFLVFVLALYLADIRANSGHSYQEDSAHVGDVAFQPDEGLRSGRSFQTALKIPRPPSGHWTYRVALHVPDGMLSVRSEPKPGWQIRILSRVSSTDGSAYIGTTTPSKIIFEALKDAPTQIGSLEFHLHIHAGCEFHNTSEAIRKDGAYALVWRTTQYVRSVGAVPGVFDSEAIDWSGISSGQGSKCAPHTFVTSDAVCPQDSGLSLKFRRGFGMQWLGHVVPPMPTNAGGASTAVSNESSKVDHTEHLEQMVVGLEEDRTFDGHDPRAHDHSLDYRKGSGRHTARSGGDFGHPGMNFGFQGNAQTHQGSGRKHSGHVHHWHQMLKIVALLGVVILVLLAGAALLSFASAQTARAILLRSHSKDVKEALLEEDQTGSTKQAPPPDVDVEEASEDAGVLECMEPQTVGRVEPPLDHAPQLPCSAPVTQAVL